MSTISPERSVGSQQSGNGMPLLCNGDRMKQPEFHRRYEAYPKGVKFELVGGTVYMASPLRMPHGRYHPKLNLILGIYETGTPGVEVADNATVILGEESEPQPDLMLRILTEYGGQSRVNEDDYCEGAPELVAEIAHSSRAIDMNQKREDYERSGVLEYLVLCVEERELYWFHFPSGRPIRPDRQGVARSRVFPGLWIDVPALLQRNGPRLTATVQQGLASPAHSAFVKRLEKARKQGP
jgi:Uma2 family endonuclease